MVEFDADNDLHTQIQYRLINQLSESERRYRELVENLREIVFKCEPDGKILFLNQAWTRTLGYAIADVLDQPITHFIVSEDHPFWNIAINHLEQDSEVRQELRFLDDAGNIVWLELAVMVNQQAEISGSLVDITDRKQAEALLQQTNADLEQRVQQRTIALTQTNLELTKALTELQQTQTQLLQAEKMSSLSHLVGGIAHEINNPVSFIQGNIGCLQNNIQDLLYFVEQYLYHTRNPPSELQDIIHEIDWNFLKRDIPNILRSMERGAQRIRQIVVALRNFSRMDEVDLKRVDLHEGIESTIMLLQNRLSLPGSRRVIALQKNYSNLPLVECYPNQINQVIMGLLINAIDAIEEQHNRQSEPQDGVINIHTRHVGDQRIQIQISDNGVGIPENIQAYVFNPFFTTKTVGKGMGMSLAIGYQIITENHQGQIYLDSNSGEGTTFCVEIPVQQAPVD